MSIQRLCLSLVLAVTCTLLTVVVASAAERDLAAASVPAPKLESPSYILVDARSGRVLAERAADARLEPASLTKLMTAYIAFSAIAQGRLGSDELATISERAWRMKGSRTFLEPRSRVPIEALLKGLIVQSGNDAAIALAEHIAGSEAAFVQLMNQYAAQLGLDNTHFKNPHGWPNKGHYSSARDLANLALARARNFPEHDALFATREFTWNNIYQPNRNRLLWRDPSVNGIKTGYTARAKYCQAASAERDGIRLVTVLLGAPTPQTRTREVQALLDYGFRVAGMMQARQETTAGLMDSGTGL